MEKKKKEIIKKKLGLIVLRYIVLFSLLGALIAFVNYTIANRKVVTYTPPAPMVSIESPYIGSIKKTVVLPTYIEAKDLIPVVPFVSGTIMEYPVKVGEYVEKDQLLTQIDTTLFKQQKLQAEAAYKAYESTYERVEKLFLSNSTSAQNFDEIKAKRDASKAQLELANVQLGYASVKAPVSGTVLLAPLAKGSIAAAPNPVAVIADLSNQIVNIQVPEKYFDIFTAHKNQLSITVERPNSGTSTTAQVISIDPYIKPESKVFLVKCQLRGDLSYFRPGMYVLASITYDSKDNVYLLPQSARKTDGSLYYYNPGDGTANYLSPDDLNIQMENEKEFEVPDKFAPYKFIVDGQNTVFDGQKVSIEGAN